QRSRLEYRQADYSGVTARQRLDENAANPLYCVCARLAQWFPAPPVAQRFTARDFPHAYFGSRHGRLLATRGIEGDGGKHPVYPAGKLRQHEQRFLLRTGLTERDAL